MVKLRVCVLLLEGYSGIGLLNKSPFQTLKKRPHKHRSLIIINYFFNLLLCAFPMSSQLCI